MADVNGQLAESVRLVVPRYGSWRAEVILSSGGAPTGPVTLTVGGTSFAGTVFEGGDDTADRPSLTIVSGIGWEQPLTAPLSYQTDTGVLLSTVLADLSALAGETIVQPPDTTLGSHFEAIPESRCTRLRDVLDGLRRSGKLGRWWIDPDGSTRFGIRTGVEATARATNLRTNASLGLRIVGIDTPEPFLPGNTIDGAVIDRLVVIDEPGEEVAELWTITPEDSNPTPTIRESVKRMVASEIDRLRYAYPRTYIVAAVKADKRLDLVPPPDVPSLPELENVERWALGEVTPALGSEVLVFFRDADQTRPVVVGLAASATLIDLTLQTTTDLDLLGGTGARLDAVSGAPASIIIGNPLAAPPPLNAARRTDTVAGGVITGGSLKVLIEG